MTNRLQPKRGTADNYYAVPLLSNSGLSAFRAKLLGEPTFSVAEATLRKGQLVHLATYQPREFERSPEFVSLLPGQVGTAQNRAVINECLKLSGIARSTPLLKMLLRNPAAIVEEDIYCLLNKVPFKIKPDLRIPNHINDLKTTACRTRDEFIACFEQYGYWRQAWLYMEGTGCKNFTFLGVSKTVVGNTFLVSSKDFKKEIREAGKEALELIRLYLERHPDYVSKSLKLFK